MMNTISILGSTGSIGRQTLDVAEQLGLQVAALTANSNVERMEAQCRKFRPRLAVMTEEAAAKELAVRLQDTSVKVLAGTDALVDAAVIPEAETVVTAVVGMVGLKATLTAIREKKRIALANKETLVCAGELVMSEADRCGAEIVSGGEGVAGVDADAHPRFVLHALDQVGEVLEAESEVRTLPRGVLDHRRHATGLVQRQVNRLRDQRQTFLVAALLQRATGVKVQPIQPQLLATLHLVEESLPRLLQRIRIRVTEINQITVMR